MNIYIFHFYGFFSSFSAFTGVTSSKAWTVSLVKPLSLYYMKCHCSCSVNSPLHSHFKCAEQDQITEENMKRMNLSTLAELFSPNFAFFSVGMAVSQLCYLWRFCFSCRNSDYVVAALRGTQQIEPFTHFTACLHLLGAVWVGILSVFIFTVID